MHQRAQLGPVHLPGYVEGADAALHEPVEVGVEAVVDEGHGVLVGRDIGYFLVLQRLEHVFVALFVAEHERVEVGRQPVGGVKHAMPAFEAEAEVLKRLQGFQHREHLGLQGEHHAPVDFIRERGAVPFVFVAYPHHAGLGPGAQKPVGPLAEENTVQRFHQRVVRQFLDCGPDCRIEDVVDPVPEGQRAFRVDFPDYGLHGPRILRKTGFGVLKQHEQTAADILYADFEEIQGVVHAGGEILLLHLALERSYWLGERRRKPGYAPFRQPAQLLLPGAVVFAQESHRNIPGSSVMTPSTIFTSSASYSLSVHTLTSLPRLWTISTNSLVAAL